MELINGNIVISISNMITELEKEDVRAIFETGIVEGCFDELIEDLLVGEIFGDSYLTKFEVKFGGLTTDVLNDLRGKLVRSLSGLEKMSFDFEHDLYVKSQKELGKKEDLLFHRVAEIQILESKLAKANLVIDACYNIDTKFIGTEDEDDQEKYYDAVIDNLEEYKKSAR